MPHDPTWAPGSPYDKNVGGYAGAARARDRPVPAQPRAPARDQLHRLARRGAPIEARDQLRGDEQSGHAEEAARDAQNSREKPVRALPARMVFAAAGGVTPRTDREARMGTAIALK